MHESEIFQIARKFPVPEQDQYLAEACAGDLQLLSDVKELLAVYQRQKQPDSTVTRLASVDTLRIPLTPPVIDRYRIQKVLGQGGMGTVFLAEQQQPVKRLVAIKLIRSEYAYPDIIARFHQERQTLALMDHPHIARVLDAGIAEEKYPYLVMEYIEGIPITEYCQQKQLGLATRVELFSQVCLAVQHAHQKGVIHRDLKPSNILVSVVDGVPIPKVIDFGTAKVFQNAMPEAEVNTVVGSLIGTIEYMSPEQASLDRDIDTRSDIYSLGVVLYELLAGRRPFDRQELGGLNYSQILDYLRHTDIPKPSSKLIAGDWKSNESAFRRTDVIKLKQSIQGDLDWIVMKCLEKDRNRRYQTALQLSMELERYLSNEPVQAGPPSWSYKFSKLVKRHRYKAIAASLVFCSLVLGVAAATVGLVQARNAERVANQHADAADDARRKEEVLRVEVEKERDKVKEEKRIAEAVSNFLCIKLLAQGNYFTQTNSMVIAGESTIDAERDPRVSTLLKRAEKELTPEKIEENFPGQPGLQAELLRTMGMTYRGIGHYTPAIQLLERAEQILLKLHGTEHFETLRLQNGLAVAYLEAGKLQKAIPIFQKVNQAYSNTRQEDLYEAILVQSNLGHALQEAGKYPEALDLREKAAAKSRQKYGELNHRTLKHESGIAATLWLMGRTSEATLKLERLRPITEKTLGADHPVYHEIINNLAYFYQRSDKLANAITLLKELADKQNIKLGERHPTRMRTLTNLASALRIEGKLVESLRLFEFVRRTYEECFDPDHPSVLAAIDSIATVYRDMGKHEEALKLFELAAKKQVSLYGDDHPDALRARHNVGCAYFSLERWDEAIRILEPVYRARSTKHGQEHPETLLTKKSLAASYLEARRFQDAFTLTDQMLQYQTNKLGDEHLETVKARFVHAYCLHGMGKNKEALPLILQVSRNQTRHHSKDHPELVNTMNLLGTVYFALRQWNLGIEQLEPVCEARKKSLGPQHRHTQVSQWNLAICYKEVGRYPEALALLDSILITREQLLGTEHIDTLKVGFTKGVCLVSSGQLKEGIQHLEKVLAQRERQPAGSDDVAISCVHHLGTAFWKTRQFNKAIAAYQREVSYCINKRGDLHPSTLLAKANLGVNYKEVGQFEQALPLLEQAYQARKQARTAFAGLALLECHLKLSHAEAAMQICNEVVSDIHQQEPKNTARTVKDLMSLVNILDGSKAYDLASPLIDDILLRYEQTQAASKESVLNNNSLARAYSLKGRVLLLRKNNTESEKYLLKANSSFRFDQPIKSALLFRWMNDNLDDLILLYSAMNLPDKIEHWTKQKQTFTAANGSHTAAGK